MIVHVWLKEGFQQIARLEFNQIHQVFYIYSKNLTNLIPGQCPNDC